MGPSSRGHRARYSGMGNDAQFLFLRRRFRDFVRSASTIFQPSKIGVSSWGWRRLLSAFNVYQLLSRSCHLGSYTYWIPFDKPPASFAGRGRALCFLEAIGNLAAIRSDHFWNLRRDADPR